MTFHIFVGYDEREKSGFDVVKHSLESRTDLSIKVHKLHHRPLKQQGLFKRRFVETENGQYIDEQDGRPFSTQFSFTRFLVPELWKREQGEKSSLVMFVDADFLFLTDIRELYNHLRLEKLRSGGRHPVYVVQHDYKPDTDVKMDGMKQVPYNMKLWSSMMVFDMDHEANQRLTADVVNTKPGMWLQTFQWIRNDMTDELYHLNIGAIPEEWNFIPDHSEKNARRMSAIHWTKGGPWFPEYRNCKYGDLWLKEYNSFISSKISSLKFNLEELI